MKTCTIFIILLLLNVLFEILSKRIISNLYDTSVVLNILNHQVRSQISLGAFDDKEIEHILNIILCLDKIIELWMY